MWPDLKFPPINLYSMPKMYKDYANMPNSNFEYTYISTTNNLEKLRIKFEHMRKFISR